MAIQFFTRLPVNINIDFNEKNVKSAFYFFPVLGGIIGGLCLLPIYFVPNSYLETAAVISVIIYFLITGGIHTDGLADTFDGFCSAREKDKILEIMKDPHIGTFGTLAITLTCIIRWICYTGVMPFGGILILAGIISRFCGLTTVIFSKPAKDTGLGTFFHKSASKISFFFWLIPIELLCFFYPEIASFSFKHELTFIFLLKFLLFPAAALILTYIIINISNKKIKGTTGDVNGCIVELTEILILLLTIFIRL